MMGVIGAFVHRGLVTVPAEICSPNSVILRTGRYERSQDACVEVGVWTISLAEGERVAALGRVGCRETGLVCVILVVASRGSLSIRRLDVEESRYESLGVIEVGGGDRGGVGCLLECWIADGPIVVARYERAVVVACERLEDSVAYLEFERRGGLKWKADMLEGSFERVFVAGSQVLCVSGDSGSNSGSGSNSSSEFVRHAELLHFSLPPENQVGRYSPTLAKVPLPLGFDPHLITCVAYVRSTLKLPYKVVFGTSEGRLKCCSRDEVIMEVTLEEPPLSVLFAEAAHDVPVLVVSLGGMDRKVVTFFADSLRQINSWTGVHQVVVDDLARVGHDQMLLITQLLSSSTSPFPEHCLRISLLQCGPQNASDKQRRKVLNSINEALEIRLQDGVKELRVAEQRRLDKMRMLTAACNLMQSISVQQVGCKPGDTSLPDDAVFVDSVQLQETYLGRCFLIINVLTNKNLPEGFQLRRPTLFATSLHGFVKSRTSCLPSQANSQRFLVSFPLKDCHFPLHIILAAEVSLDKSKPSGWDFTEASFDAEGSVLSSEPRRIYTQSIHSMDTLAMPCYEADVSGTSGNPTAICETWMSLMGGALPQEHLSALVRAVSLQTSSGNHTWSSQPCDIQEGERQNVMEEHTKAPLTSMYVHDISVVSKTTGSSNLLETLANLHGPRIVEMVVQFADVMLKELQSSDVSDGSDLGVAELQAATDRCFCHLLSSITYNSFGHF